MRGQFRLFFVSLVAAVAAIPSSASALSLTSEGGFEFDVSTTDGSIGDGLNDTYDSCYTLNLTIGGSTTRYSAGAATPGMSLDGRQIDLPEVAVGGAMARRFIYVPATGGNYARYLDVIRNPGSSTLNVTITIQGNMGSDSDTVVFGDSSGDLALDPSDSWFGTDDSSDGGGDTTAAHVIQGSTPRVGAGAAMRSSDAISWSFVASIPAGESVAILTFAVQATNRAAATTEALALVEAPDTALVGVGDYLDQIINFGFAVPGAPRVTFSGATTVDEGTDINIGVELVDEEGDAVSFSWDTDDDGNFGELTGMNSFMIAGDSTDGPGQRRVGVRATDGTNEITRYRTISVRNVAPLITSTADVTTTGIDADYQYAIIANDPAGSRDPLTYTIVTGPERMTVSAAGVVSWIPTVGDVTTMGNPEHVQIRVSDGDMGESTQEWDIDVLPTHAPTAPVPTYPAEGSGVREVMPRLVVQDSSDADLEPIQYQFQIDTVATFDSEALQDSGWIDEQPALTYWYVTTPLVPGTYYHWRARATDGTLNTIWRTAHFFVVPDDVEMPDLGVTDGGVTVDAGPVTPTTPPDDPGCSVSHATPSHGATGAALLTLLVLCWLARRRGATFFAAVLALGLVASPTWAQSPPPPATGEAASDGAAAAPSEEDSLLATQAELEATEAGPSTAPTSITNDSALAEPVDAQSNVDPNARPEGSLSHRHQVGIRVGAGMGGLFAVKYGAGPECGDTIGESTCRRAGVPTLDLELAFAVNDVVELSALARFGLSANVASDVKPLIFGIGVRAYANPHGLFKFFVGGRLMLDIQSSDAPQWNSIDFGARGEGGFAIDFIRWAGIYVQLGAGIQVMNGLYFMGDATGGIQARFP